MDPRTVLAADPLDWHILASAYQAARRERHRDLFGDLK